MKKTLYPKFLFAYLLFGVAGFFFISTIHAQYTEQRFVENNARQLYVQANSIANDYAHKYLDQDVSLADISWLLQSTASYLDIQMWVVDTSNHVLQTSDTTYIQTGALLPDFDAALMHSQKYICGTFGDLFPEDYITVKSPISLGINQQKGFLFLHQPVSDIVKEADGLRPLSYMTYAAVYLLSLIILVVFTTMVYRPLLKITKATNEFAEGNLSFPLSVHKSDEIGYLANSLSYMATKLRESEDSQRKFLANISHDFRSPLTSIKGYVEAILDGTIPHDAQDKYLNIVLFETNRLNKLTSGLLDLNNYAVQLGTPDSTDFDVNAVIKNTVAAFEGSCREKKISVNMLLTGKTQLVTADMGKIQQVLYNLLDNAIKFSHHNSKIYIETTEKNEKIFVSVKDTGIGIPKDCMSKIWDRFYKTDLSRGKDKNGTGLGLCIVKEIIHAHKEKINVISTEGVGTEFIFTLTKAKNIDDDL